MITEAQYDEAMQSLIDYEIFKHNQNILKDLDCDDFKELLDYCRITEKIQWVDKPKFEPEPHPDKYGIFTLEYVDQWSVGMEGDSYEGFMYVKVKGHKQYLKIPYSC